MNGSARYWCPPTGRIVLDAGGFLADPGDPFGIDQTLSTYDEVDQHRCLVLLGEPGIGKTTELERAVVQAGARAPPRREARHCRPRRARLSPG